MGVKIFSLGFGRRLFGVEIGGTDYRVCIVPAGGYVLMEGADPFQDGGDADSEPDSPTSFMNKPVWQRLIIVAAGPAFNLILPVVVFTALFMVGEPGTTPTITQIDRYSPASQAGLLVGDHITHIDDEKIATWGALQEVLEHAGAEPVFHVQRQGEELSIPVTRPAGVVLDGGVAAATVYGLTNMRPAPYVVLLDGQSALAQAGLESGDYVSAVAGEEVEIFADLVAALDAAQGPTVIEYKRLEGEGEDALVVDHQATVTPTPSLAQQSELAIPATNQWGLAPPWLSVHTVEAGSPAEVGGLLVGDVVLAVDGQPVSTFQDVITLVKRAQDGEGDVATARAVTLSLLRQGELQERIFLPRIDEDFDRFGRYTFRPVIGFNTWSFGVTNAPSTRSYGLVPAVEHAMVRTADAASKVVSVVGMMLTGQASVSKNVGGPIAIFRQAAAAAERGIFDYAYMLAGLSVSLAVVNFLPVPVLDGGQFLFYAAEGIRGRPLSLQIRERAQQIGVLFLLGLMFAVLIIDVRNWIGAG